MVRVVVARCVDSGEWRERRWLCCWRLVVELVVWVEFEEEERRTAVVVE